MSTLFEIAKPSDLRKPRGEELRPIRFGSIRVRGTGWDGKPMREYVVEHQVVKHDWEGRPWQTQFVAFDPKHPHLLRPVKAAPRAAMSDAAGRADLPHLHRPAESAELVAPGVLRRRVGAADP